MEYEISSLSELNALAIKLAKRLRAGSVILLKGPLGVGKTALASAIINSLRETSNPPVTSPTFNIVHLYDSPRGTIWHFDLYRITSATELQEIGLSEALSSGISIIEWPEILGHSPANSLLVELSFREGCADDTRLANVTEG